MSTLRHLHTLTHYAAWANDLLYARLAALPQQELLAPRPIRFGNILRTLNHVYLMDIVWQAHLQGVPHHLTTRNPETAPPFGRLRDAQRQIDAWYVGFADTLTAEMGDEVVHFTFIGGGRGAMRREDIVLHAVNHTTYHRGHIAGMLYQIPVEPPTTDLPVFLRGDLIRPVMNTPGSASRGSFGSGAVSSHAEYAAIRS